MGEAFRLGGWGMYPTTIIGLVLLAAAIGYLRRPSSRGMRVISNLRLLTLLSSALGFTAGVINTLTHLPERFDEAGTHALVGVGESLVNIGAGLFILVLATIITTLGAYRDDRSDAELVDPRAP